MSGALAMPHILPGHQQYRIFFLEGKLLSQPPTKGKCNGSFITKLPRLQVLLSSEGRGSKEGLILAPSSQGTYSNHNLGKCIPFKLLQTEKYF
jgi:hypothetical protein